MQTDIPHFKYRSKALSCRQSGYIDFGCIEADGEVIHKIENLAEFHKAFGYTQDMAKAGILPDEFIWEEYIRDAAANCATCFQIRILEYLIEHSAFFRKKYGNQCDNWIAAHAEARSAKGAACCACKAKSPA